MKKNVDMYYEKTIKRNDGLLQKIGELLQDPDQADPERRRNF